ncbi:hypothetical protein [Candidatus Ichthyocystis sparus]|uniref:hypothetical protein n=1 Tax=Candidatus Ichthyocystis sparus TaxID=1561004 RepID=UPI000B893D43|nr:hypothetical protein [Candidatus Ichthyocystis sparus]
MGMGVAQVFLQGCKKLKHVRLTGADEDEPAADDQDEPGPDEHEEPGLSSRPQINTARYELDNYSISQRSKGEKEKEKKKRKEKKLTS